MRTTNWKFRGLTTQGWVYGDLVRVKCKAYIVPEESVGKGIAAGYEVNASTVGQYTGIKDKAGNEIYDGDLVVFRGEKSEVYYNTAHASFFLKFENGRYPFHGLWEGWSPEYIIDGNKWEKYKTPAPDEKKKGDKAQAAAPQPVKKKSDGK